MPPTGLGVPPGGGRSAFSLLPVPSWLLTSEGTPEHAGKDSQRPWGGGLLGIIWADGRG